VAAGAHPLVDMRPRVAAHPCVLQDRLAAGKRISRRGLSPRRQELLSLARQIGIPRQSEIQPRDLSPRRGIRAASSRHEE
jgi:hypothetical protein